MADNRSVQISAAAFAKLHQVSTATLTTQLLNRGFHNTFLQLHLLRPDKQMVGYAFTLRYVPMREDLIDTQYDNRVNVQRIAVVSATKDDVLIVDARGDVRAASFGHILATRLHARGVSGLITDGALRDTPGFKKLEMPSYCKASHATTSFIIHHPIEMNVPIGCAGVLIMPGDVLVTDGEGVPFRHRSPKKSLLMLMNRNSEKDSLRKKSLPGPAFAGFIHLTGITPPLSGGCQAIVKEAVARAHAAGVPVSFDVNYRSELWSPIEAAATLHPILQGTALLFCAKRDAELLYGLSGTPEEVVEQLAEKTQAQHIVISIGSKGVVGWDGQQFIHQSAYETLIIDALGA